MGATETQVPRSQGQAGPQPHTLPQAPLLAPLPWAGMWGEGVGGPPGGPAPLRWFPTFLLCGVEGDRRLASMERLLCAPETPPPPASLALSCDLCHFLLPFWSPPRNTWVSVKPLVLARQFPCTPFACLSSTLTCTSSWSPALSWEKQAFVEHLLCARELTHPILLHSFLPPSLSSLSIHFLSFLTFSSLQREGVEAY